MGNSTLNWEPQCITMPNFESSVKFELLLTPKLRIQKCRMLPIRNGNTCNMHAQYLSKHAQQ